MVMILYRRLRFLEGKKIFVTLLKTMLSGAVMGVMMIISSNYVGSFSVLLRNLIPISFGVTIFMLCLLVFKEEEVTQILGILRIKLGSL